ERKEVETVVDQVELVGALEEVGDMETLAHLGLDLGVFRITAFDDGGETSRSLRIAGRKQRHVDTACDEALGEKRRELLPRPVGTRRRPPGDRREDRHSKRAGCPCGRGHPSASVTPAPGVLRRAPRTPSPPRWKLGDLRARVAACGGNPEEC